MKSLPNQAIVESVEMCKRSWLNSGETLGKLLNFSVRHVTSPPDSPDSPDSPASPEKLVQTESHPRLLTYSPLKVIARCVAPGCS